MRMTKQFFAASAVSLMLSLSMVGCTSCSTEQATDKSADQATEQAADQTEQTEQSATDTSQVADASDMAEPVELDTAGLTPVHADELVEGTYDIEVDSSSSMFRIVACKLIVTDGQMTARMTMSGTGYLYVYLGTPEEAAAAPESDYIPFEEDGDAHVFTIPVEALNTPIDCAAFSKKKEQWYGRQLVFRADSLPAEARAGGAGTSLDDLALADGTYEADVKLEGGSGKATVDSPARITVLDGAATARIVWSSPHYDYMIVDDERLEPVSTDANSEFDVPVSVFDYPIAVVADTTAMSKPHEIEYTLTFDSSTIQTAEEPGLG